MLESLFDRPIVTVNDVQAMTGTTYQAANNLVMKLTKIGILRERTGFTRNRRFEYASYIALFNEQQPMVKVIEPGTNEPLEVPASSVPPHYILMTMQQEDGREYTAYAAPTDAQ